MATVYCIGNQEVFLDYYSYLQYCIKNSITPEYSQPLNKTSKQEWENKGVNIFYGPLNANDEQVKQMPMHTCGEDGPIEEARPKTIPEEKKNTMETKERIEKAAEAHVEQWYGRDPKINKSIAGANYIFGATAEHTIVWNEAIDEVIGIMNAYHGDQRLPKHYLLLLKEITALKR